MKAQQILGLLDRHINRFAHPPPPNFDSEKTVYAVGDARLTVFRNPQQWILAIEMLTTIKGPFFFHELYLYGNCLSEQGIVYPVKEPCTMEQFWDESGRWRVNRYHVHVKWNEQLYTFAPTPEEYSGMGIIFPPERADTDDLEPWEMLWYVCEKLRPRLFYSEEELLQAIEKRAERTGLSSQLKRFFQTTRWEHPEVYAGQVPSDTESFRVLAQMIETGDVLLWDRVDRSRFNSYWRYYEDRECVEREVLE